MHILNRGRFVLKTEQQNRTIDQERQRVADLRRQPSRKDPEGYYAALGVDYSTTAGEIKKAFKAKAKQFHPDKNAAPETTQWFQFINEAYRILSDARARAGYDARSCITTENLSSDNHHSEPVACS